MSSSESAWFYPPAPSEEPDEPVVPGRTRRFRGPSLARELAILAPLLALFVAWFVVLRPTYLGGSTTFVEVAGTGMEPTLRDGDLAVVREQASYGPADVVALRVPRQDGSSNIVVRRIVDGSASAGFVVRGDDRDAADPWRPGQEHVIGRVWFRVAAGGRVLGWLQQPVAIAGIAALLIVAFMLVGGRSTRPTKGGAGASAEPEATAAIDEILGRLRTDAAGVLREAERRAEETRRRADLEAARTRAEIELLRAEIAAERARFSAHLRSVADGIDRALAELSDLKVTAGDPTIVVDARTPDARSPRSSEPAPSIERSSGS